MKAIEFGYLGNESDNVLSDMCKQVWNNSREVMAARMALADAMAAAIKADKVVSAVIESTRQECVDRVCDKLAEFTKVGREGEYQSFGELTEYLNNLSVVDGLPYNHVVKSKTYLDTENRKESFCVGLYQEYIRIKRIAGAQKKEKTDKAEKMLRQLKSYGIEKETAIARAAQMYSISGDKALEVWDSINI